MGDAFAVAASSGCLMLRIIFCFLQMTPQNIEQYKKPHGRADEEALGNAEALRRAGGLRKDQGDG